MDLDQIACMIIANAGECRSYAMSAIAAAQEGEHAKAQELIVLGEEALLKSHDEHSKLLVAEAKGNGVSMSLLLIHAADHLSNAEVVLDLARVILDLYRR